jgi:tRNA pseudouridine38-40 synthase
MYTSAKTTVREIVRAEVEEVPCGTADPVTGMPREIVIRVSGRGFLYNMVRIIAGTLMEIGRGAKSPAQMPQILASLDRRSAGPTAPACGLTLVRYEITEPGTGMVFD